MMQINNSLRILLADDNPMHQKIALKMLSRLGHKADTVDNGLEALKALEHISYDMILMDVQMPEMDGIEATRQIRERWPDGPIVVFLTACDYYREACFEAGANDFLTKPVKMQELHAAIEHNAY